jgi:hypothetical protein
MGKEIIDTNERLKESERKWTCIISTTFSRKDRETQK